MLTHSLVMNHGFVDGNKRTALLVVHLLIERSGWTFLPPAEREIDDLLVTVAQGNMGVPEIGDWYRTRLVRASRRRQGSPRATR